MITHRAIRFVDRDMFMRYRGGGIRHKYMRKIEEIFENMSLERIHHKERKRASSEETFDADPIDSSDDEPEGSEQTQGAEATEGDGGVDEDDEGDDSDYEPDEADSGGSDSSDSDSGDSESEDEVSETYGLGAL